MNANVERTQTFIDFSHALSERAFILAALCGYLIFREIKSCNTDKMSGTLHAMPNLFCGAARPTPRIDRDCKLKFHINLPSFVRGLGLTPPGEDCFLSLLSSPHMAFIIKYQ